MHSANRLLSEYQHPKVGDTLGYGKSRMRLERVEPEHVLALRSKDGNWVWTLLLEERARQARLISRNRFRVPTALTRIGMLPMEPASLLMEHKMLRGIKHRAEGSPPKPPRRQPRDATSEPREAESRKPR
jgi:hypothetical protein